MKVLRSVFVSVLCMVAPLKALASELLPQEPAVCDNMSVYFSTSYVAFLLQQNVYAPSLTDPLTAQLVQIGATTVFADADAPRVIFISFDMATNRARVRVTPVDRASGEYDSEATVVFEADYDSSVRQFTLRPTSQTDN